MKVLTGHVLDCKDQSYRVGPISNWDHARPREVVKQYDLTVRVYDGDPGLLVGKYIAIMPIAEPA
jgi:hypothetical protein